MSKEDGMVQYKLAPGEEPTVHTADICADLGHEYCKGIETTTGYEGQNNFLHLSRHQVVTGEPNWSALLLAAELANHRSH
jgi:hypothetical protein